MNAGASWVLDFATHVFAALEQTQRLHPTMKRVSRLELLRRSAVLDKKLPPSMPRLFLAWHATEEDKRLPGFGERIDMRRAVKYLLVATAILVGAFAMRRRGEVESLRAGCIEEPQPGLCVLSIYIEKTLRRLDWVPVPNLVNAAVEGLEKLTKDTRTATGEDWLFHYDRRPGSGLQTAVRFDSTELLNEFAAVNGLEPPDGQLAWNFAFHQLRRGSGVAYYHASPMSSLDALSRMLRHFDSNLTRLYVYEVIPGAMAELRQLIDSRVQLAREAMTEEDRAWVSSARGVLDDLADRDKVFNEVRCEALVHRMLKMLDGEETPIGRGAARLHHDIRAMVADAQADVRIGSRANDPSAERDAIVPLLHAYALRHFLEPVPGGPAHCLCAPGSEDDLARAECSKVAERHRAPWAVNGPRAGSGLAPVEFTSTYVCLKCDLCAVFSEGQHAIEADQRSVATSAERGATPAARADATNLHEELLAATKAATEAARAG